MIGKTIKAAALATICAAFAGHTGWADETPEAPGNAVLSNAKLLKDAEDVVFSAQQLKPIALDNLPAKIDPATLGTPPGSEVSALARTLRDLDPADIPATAHTLGGTARGSLPGAASAHSAGGHVPSLPSAAQGRSRGRGRH